MALMLSPHLDEAGSHVMGHRPCKERLPCSSVAPDSEPAKDQTDYLQGLEPEAYPNSPPPKCNSVEGFYGL